MKRRGFSLTEMLVVLGIILILVAFSLPMIMSARKSARNTVCMYRLRDLAAAITTYQSHYIQSLPLAVSAQRPLPENYRGLEAYYGSPIDPSEQKPGKEGAAEFEKIYGKNPPVLPSLREVLAPYLKTEKNMWICPMQEKQKTEPTTAFFTPGYTDMFAMFTPGYKYMSTFELRPLVFREDQGVKDLVYKYRLKDLMARNVAGLKPNMLKTMYPSDAGIVVLVERSTVFHSKAADDFLELDITKPSETGTFRMNALYLDGHVDTWHIKNYDEMVKKIHPPIKQRTFGREFESDIPEAYVWPLPKRGAKPEDKK